MNLAESIAKKNVGASTVSSLNKQVNDIVVAQQKGLVPKKPIVPATVDKSISQF